MTLETAYFVSQILSTIAIVVSLGFVILQIRHAARATRAQTQQAISAIWMSAASTIADHAEVFDAGMNAREEGLVDLPEKERLEFTVMIHAYFRHYENICMQSLSGYIDAHIWASWSEHLRTVLRAPGVRVWWRMRGTHFAPQFQAHVNSEIGRLSEVLD